MLAKHPELLDKSIAELEAELDAKFDRTIRWVWGMDGWMGWMDGWMDGLEEGRLMCVHVYTHTPPYKPL